MNIEKILNTIRPFVEAKAHNPNKSLNANTTRVINIKAIHLAALNNLYEELSQEHPKDDVDDITSRLLTRVAFLERDVRTSFRQMELLQKAGVITDEAVDSAASLVSLAQERGDTFLDVDRIREDLVKAFIGDNNNA